MRTIIFIYILIPAVLYSQSIDTNVFKYYPLNIGNRWTWHTTRNFAPGSDNNSLRILRTMTANNHLYYVGKKELRYIFYSDTTYTNIVYYRIDSLNGNLYGYDSVSHSECLIDSLNAQQGDSAKTSCGNDWNRTDTLTYNRFGTGFKSKEFLWSNYFEAGGYHIYSLNIGSIYSRGQAVMSITEMTLSGCIIGGVLYGDTSFIVGIDRLSSQVPSEFLLSQNYPNPFNPVTKINFAIPGVGSGRDRSVKFVIYDVLGREVATLINQQMQPGNYSIDWDGTNYPSGVYFYKLESGDYVETKKMALMK